LLIFLVGFAAGPLVFTNLYFEHNYYWVANGTWLILSLGVALAAISEFRPKEVWPQYTATARLYEYTQRPQGRGAHRQCTAPRRYPRRSNRCYPITAQIYLPGYAQCFQNPRQSHTDAKKKHKRTAGHSNHRYRRYSCWATRNTIKTPHSHQIPRSCPRSCYANAHISTS
jgi:hypothetical protein